MVEDHVPSGQLRQAESEVAPMALDHEPGGHVWQGLPILDHDPRAQDTQTLIEFDPETEEYVPAAHDTH